MPDTPELQRHFGQPGNQQPGCGFPVAHLLVLFHAGTGLLREILTSPLRTNDMPQVVHLHPALEPGDIGLGDRGFCSYAHLALLSLKGIFGVFRIHQRKKVEFQLEEPRQRRGGYPQRPAAPLALPLGGQGPRGRVDQAQGGAGVDDRVPVRDVTGAAGGARAALPRGAARVSGPGSDLVTTLLDPELYPLEALAELYRQRWQADSICAT